MYFVIHHSSLLFLERTNLNKQWHCLHAPAINRWRPVLNLEMWNQKVFWLCHKFCEPFHKVFRYLRLKIVPFFVVSRRVYSATHVSSIRKSDWRCRRHHVNVRCLRSASIFRFGKGGRSPFSEYTKSERLVLSVMADSCWLSVVQTLLSEIDCDGVMSLSSFEVLVGVHVNYTWWAVSRRRP